MMDIRRFPQTTPTRSMEQALDDLWEKFKRMRPTDPARAQLARVIRQLDDAIGAKEGL